MSSSSNPNVSSLTSKVYNYERTFIQESGQTFSGALVTPLIKAGSALILHAEAVTKASQVGLLSVFNRSNQEEIQRTKAQGWSAYNASLRSFFSIFSKNLLSPLPEAPAPIAAPQPIVHQTPPQNFQPAPDSPSIPILSNPIIDELRTQSAPPATQLQHVVPPSPSLFSLNEHDNMGHHSPNEGHHTPISEFPSAPTSPTPEAFNDTAQIRAILNYARRNSSGNNSYVKVGETSSCNSEELDPETYAKIKAEYVGDHKSNINIPTTDEEFRLAQLVLAKMKQETAYQEETRILLPQEVTDSLQSQKKLTEQNIHQPSETSELEFKIGPESQYANPNWFLDTEYAGNLEIGICQYTKDLRGINAQHLATTFNIQIENKNFPATLCALFDPQIGTRAASYLVERLPKALEAKIVALNSQALTEQGIYNALSLTLLELNRNFIESNKDQKAHRELEVIADQGSTATICLTISDKLWTAQWGNSRAVLDNGGTPIQLTADLTPDQHKEKIKKMGGTVQNGLVNGVLPMSSAFGHSYLKGAINSRPGITVIDLNEIGANQHLVIATRPIFEVISSATITKWLHSRMGARSKALAHDVVFSIFEYYKEKIQSKSMACLVIKPRANNNDDNNNVRVDESNNRRNNRNNINSLSFQLMEDRF